ncbi:glycine--tRNA ligase subunit beta [Helicobacter sp. 11S02596-1]|uniref:glycine--tRNA ligase subunit beta n=1 Tax=Helicobacter sp. 11S02596-1 TaxID=1476194 RepID=UPI0015DE1042|nr:glycine--tRNA ligase subunit beta [Helicobacter sp. 11S02596-1]
MNTKDLLVEILVEELPALPFLKEFPHIGCKWQEALEKYHLSATPEVFYTPRRIVIFCPKFPLMTSDRNEEFFGPPLGVGYVDGDVKKGLSKAGEGFCKKAQASKEDLCVITKDGKEILYFSRKIAGVGVGSVLPAIISDFLDSLNFGKSMRWGSLQKSFIRPIRNICILFGDETIAMNAFGFEAKKATKIHPDKGFLWQEVRSIKEYFDVLKNGCVILSQAERKAKILQELHAFSQEKNISVQIDNALLEEIVAITEYPRALFGEFDAKFLTLPPEVIITSMKENQRYFAIKKDEKLYNGFIVVSNSTALDVGKIIAGNQKVLKARLSDAMFFYQNDLQRGLKPDGLGDVAFGFDLGSLKDKVAREKNIALFLVQKYQAFLDMPSERAKNLIARALEISKADLLSEMVYEFPELQGLMGYYYAKAQGEDELVCQAIKEQYLPTGEDSALPSGIFSSIVALSNKLDSIFSLFSIGKIPTGSKDPFALRRACAGVLKIVLEYQIPFDLHSDIAELFATCSYKPLDIALIEDFFIERLEGIVGLNASIYRSVLGSKERDVSKIVLKANALHTFFENSDKEAFISTFKRVANITKEIKNHKENTNTSKINENLFKQPEEIALYKAYKGIEAKEFRSIDAEIAALFSLKTPLDVFFQNVLVNDNDSAIRENRKNLIFSIYQKFLQIGDVKEIAF